MTYDYSNRWKVVTALGSEWLREIQQFPVYLQIICGLIIIFVVLFCLYVLFSVLLGPIMWVYNKLTDKNKSNVLAQQEFLLGELTEKIEGASTGEVMETGSKTASSVHPARLYKTEDVDSGLLLPIGTSVIIIDFDSEGAALVVKNKNLVE